ncbi:uncharacterized protein LOC131434928 [Malaya genurostris]|uniref:uncharacterized protein LOC131434928 n=1 Tax=Malaya genurostris TaxID=325434 RepID=UPI0026F3BE7E|nr:uncharacterized protein LOC131434928 [Malaya genurostris]
MSDEQNNLTSSNNDRHCKRCNRADADDDMVCCDVCESWIHFQCAGVSESIAEPDRSFKCSKCMTDWDGESKSAVSFNESSVSKSSRASQKLQLSLQLLEEQQNLKQKQIEIEQEYLRKRYELLLQIEEEKDSSKSSRKSGISVKRRCEQMENWLNKGTQVDRAGQSEPKMSEQKVTLPAPVVCQKNDVPVPKPTSFASNVLTVTNPNSLNLNPGVPVPGGSISTESFVSTPGKTTANPHSISSVVSGIVIPAEGSSITSAAVMSTSVSLIPVSVPTISTSILPSVTDALIRAVPVCSHSRINTGEVIQTIPPMSSLQLYKRNVTNSGLVSSGNTVFTSTVQHPSISGLAVSGVPWLPEFPVLNPVSSSPLPDRSYRSIPGLATITSTVQHPSIPGLAVSGVPWLPEYPVSSYYPPTSVPVSAVRPASVPSVVPSSLGVYGNRHDVPVSVGPNSAQLAARQVMPRELPKFNGDPHEWPIFYSSFKNTTDVCGYTDAENLARLQRCLGGAALEAVRSRLLLPASVPYVMDTLQKLYGRPEILISSLLKKVRNVPPPKSENLSSIVCYGLAIQNLVDHIVLAEQQAHLSNPMLLQELVDKLPASLKMQWGTFKQAYTNVNLATFNGFMSGLVNLASELCIDVVSVQNYQQSQRTEKQKQKEKLFTHSSVLPSTSKDRSVEESTSKACAYCGKDDHQIINCRGFKSLDVGGRWKAVRQKNLCRLCLIPHRKWPCRSKKECGQDGCRVRHNMLLHSSRNDDGNGHRSEEVVHQNHHHTKSFSLFRYLPVTLYGNGREVNTFVFLDDGSSCTLLEEGIAAQLGIEGEPDHLWLSWTGKVSRHEKTSRRLSIKISGDEHKEMFQLANVRTVRELGLPSQTLDYSELSDRFPHLQGLPVASYIDAKPGMIIGLEHVRLLTSLKTREGCSSEPVASKTRLGWCVYGRNCGNGDSVEQLHIHSCDDMSNSSLHDAMRKFFAVEEVVSTHQLESEEDKRARSILEVTTVRKGNRMETGLLWRNDERNFPNSYQMAISRLRGLEKRLAKDPDLRIKVIDQIKSYEQKQYVRKISPEELAKVNTRRTWFLPLGVVTNPKKPNKIRMVWDAAAKAGGVAFNDMLLKGPDLLVSLVNLLLRFREGKIAVCSDIREMFLRILIREEDKWSQCFLWRNSPADEVQVYVINVAMFGATSSPCTAQFVKNRNALEYAKLYPRAADAIVYNHYVDDFLDSVNSEDEAVKLIEEVQLIHAAAGFEFGKILSNSSNVLDRLGETESLNSKSLGLDKNPSCERVLGLVWVPSTDSFTFDRSAVKDVLGSNIVTPTKRQVLRTVMKLYDPLGFVAHFVVQGKILMQEIWRAGTNWDEPISECLSDLWSRWIELYDKIDEVRIPRCYFVGPKEVDEIEIHVFTDASVSACACVAYLRMSNNGSCWCSLVAAKTKVAPIRPLSVPRLEIQAAMMGARLMQTVSSALTVNIKRRFLWTDSTVVLAWLRSDSRRYPPFVSFRVGEILSLTSVDEWYYVPSKLNVADDATKWNTGLSFDPDSRWFQAPSFLPTKEQWPKQSTKVDEADASVEEVRVVAVHQAVEEIVNADRFSNWNRLVRAMAYVYKAINKWKQSESGSCLRQDEFNKAEEALWRQAQAQSYEEEIQALTKGCSVSKQSSLRSMVLYLDDKGLVRIKGRIGNASHIPYATRYPVVLPRNSRITFLLVDAFHRRFLHANNETVYNELRQKFHIPKLRTFIRQVGRICQHCKVKKAVPVPPLMGPLPKVRLTPFIRPFTYVGVDYMGPFEVKIGRSLVKRWICLFTCLTIRAVHLELVHSLSTISCVMAVRRFVSRRGAPLEIFSDNGTNFVGANRQLTEERSKIEKISKHCAATFTNADTQWHFNVPAAPHMGGPWERMVKSVKIAMKAISDSPRHPSDEVLETIMLEAEGIVNSRPLTYVPLEAEDQESLTPNHFLLYSSSGIKQPPSDPVAKGYILRDSWKLAQHIVDEFWRRWVREYLPMLTRQTKWFDAVKPLAPGDLVVVVDEQARNRWERGRILETFPDKTGQVRRATVQTNRGVFARPAVKLAVLDVVSSSQNSERIASESGMIHG